MGVRGLVESSRDSNPLDPPGAQGFGDACALGSTEEVERREGMRAGCSRGSMGEGGRMSRARAALFKTRAQPNKRWEERQKIHRCGAASADRIISSTFAMGEALVASAI